MIGFERPDDRVPEDPEREHRIEMEIVVDAYDDIERASGWHAYLDDRLGFPFAAGCTDERSASPLREGETVTVTGMADVDDCLHEMHVQAEWQGRELAVPLAQLVAVGADAETTQAVADWRYWDRRGYQIG